ncbi:TKL family protein kinase [Tritrichomonas foetus]|uniref:TKL family protein kinase n=1 Tax=Tritrichomonas foetus TaxID=1144522 RepID=A0A1J4JT08_9EUKA|nr:TKL family protein kinase [Tritrichomonas foetus]|eukprot:OHT01568.1 TKL family protein kinase [Tritrichomonas foetus]
MSFEDSEISAELGTYHVNINRFNVKKCIDNGGYAEVWTAIDKSNGEVVVLKRLTSKANKKVISLFIREVTTMAQADHPFFLKLVGFSLKQPLTIVSEYMENGSLFKYRQSSKGRSKLNPTRRTLIAMGVAHAMMFLHSQGIIHRDLKSLNVLLDNDLLPRLCDFGIARFMDSSQPMTRAIGTPHWMAPEMLSNGKYGKEVDVYSYSMILYELLTDEVPWSDTRPESMLKQVLVDQKRPALPRDTPPALKDLIKMCWSQNPKSRPSFSEIYEMFENEEVMFEDTDHKAVRSLARQLAKVKISSSPIKIRSPHLNQNKRNMKNSPKNYHYRNQSEEDEHDSYRKKSPRKYGNMKDDDVDVEYNFNHRKENLSYTQNNRKRNNFNNSSDDDYNNRYDQDNQEKSYDGIRVRKINKYNKESPFIDIDAIADPRSYTFRSELKKASTTLQKVQSRQFMNVISEHFKGNIRPAELSAVLNTLQQILQRKCHREMFIELELYNRLPIHREEIIGSCFDVLLVLFERSPTTFDESYVDTMNFLISKHPQKAIILLSNYAKSFDTLPNAWNLLDLLIQKASVFFKAMVGSELVSTLFFLCHNFADFCKARFSYVSGIFLKALQTKDNNTIKLAYNALSHFYRKDIEFDFGLITEHLNSDQLVEHALQLLIRIHDVPCLPELISILLDRATKYLEANLVLLKLAALEEGAVLIIRKPKWISYNMPTVLDTLRLYLAIMTHVELRPILSRLRQTPEFFMKLCEENDSRVLTHLSMIIRRFKIDKDLINNFSESGVFKSIFTASLDFGDDIALHAAMMILLKVGKVGFAPEYLMLGESLKEIVISNRKIAGTAVSAVTLLSQYPLCAKKFKDLKFDRLFKQLLKDPEYKEYAETFLDNLSVINFY